MQQFTVTSIGEIRVDHQGARLVLDKAFAPGIGNLEGFSHINILWWFSHCDCPQDRQNLTENAPYKGAPECIGVFATRSPMRPNPIALSCAQVTGIDRDRAVIYLAHVDADDRTPVLDIKPYMPSADRVGYPLVPAWCAHWPGSYEQSGDFDWESVFNF